MKRSRVASSDEVLPREVCLPGVDDTTMGNTLPTSALSPSRRLWYRLLLVGGSVILCLAAGEVAARALVWWRMPPEKFATLTQHTTVKGQFSTHPYLPYVLTPSYDSHNSLGFRGKEFTLQKQPGVRRVVCLGASTTYGIYVPPEQAYPSQLEDLLRAGELNCEVINAGVPGYTSMELLLTLQVRVLPLDPDVVIIYEGRNEVFPEAFNNYAPDYSHYLKTGYCDRTTNYLNKELFRISHLYMLLATYKGDRFGWSWRDEHPLYGRIRYENQPTSEELVANLTDRSRTGTYRNNLEAMAGICNAKGIKLLLCTMAFRPEKLATGILRYDPAIFEALGEQVDRNNCVVREVASRQGLPVVETAALAAEPDLFVDDCHCKGPGYARRAKLLYPMVRELLAAEN